MTFELSTALSQARLPISLRREVRYVTLAAMETCWFSSVVAVFAAFLRIRPLSPLSLFVAYWIALIAGRALPRRRGRWILLQGAAVGIAVITIVAIARIELYRDLDPLDWSWLPSYLGALVTLVRSPAPAHLEAAAVLFAFVRGLGFSQRPMTLWFTGFQFRLGIVVFFLVLVVVGLFRMFDPTPWLFAYFFVSLIAIALARIDEMETDVLFGPRWAATLVTAVALVLVLGFGLMQVLNVDSATQFLSLFSPLWGVVIALLVVIAIPLAIVVSWLAGLLSPILATFGNLFQSLSQLIPTTAPENLQRAGESALQLPFLVPLLKTLFVLGILVTAGYAIAHALNRQMNRYEEGVYERESLAGDERAAVRTPKAKPRRWRAQPIAAHSIRRIYAALNARARAAGLPRAPAETPNEYLPRLVLAWPALAADLRVITDAYVSVHYAEYFAAPEDVNRVRNAWKRVQGRLSRTRHAE